MQQLERSRVSWYQWQFICTVWAFGMRKRSEGIEVNYAKVWKWRFFKIMVYIRLGMVQISCRDRRTRFQTGHQGLQEKF